MAHLLEGDVREAPTSERSFLAGETETEFRFRNYTLITITIKEKALGIMRAIADSPQLRELSEVLITS